MQRAASLVASALRRLHYFSDWAFETAIIWLLLVGNRGSFDAAAYRAYRRPGSLGRLLPRLHYAAVGCRAGLNPGTSFDAAGTEVPKGYRYPPHVFAMFHGVVNPAPIPDHEADREGGGTPEHWFTPERQRFNRIWPVIELDLKALPERPAQLIPDEHLHYQLAQNIFEVTPYLSPNVSARVAAAVPRSARHILAVPWLGLSGGSEKIVLLLLEALRRHYATDELCIVAPEDAIRYDTLDRANYHVPIVAINDFDPECDSDGRIAIFDRLMTECAPQTVHTVQSNTAWLAFVQRGAHYSGSRLFGHIYSDLLTNNMRLGAFWEYLPDCIEHLAGVFADNAAVVRRAGEVFGFPPTLLDRFHVLRTPVLDVPGGDPRNRLYPFQPTAGPGSLWMSRVAREKRLDVLAEIARRVPNHPIAMYGTILKFAPPPDLSWLDEAPNVDFRGRYENIFGLPLHEFSSYIFTSGSEGMPIALLEAAMLGLPLVAPAIGGIPELVDDTTGWLITDPSDAEGYVAAIREAGADRGMAARRVAKVQQRLQDEYSWDAFLRTLNATPSYLSR
ncbi:glycosyltransferase family 4 protein [Rhizobium sp. BR 315]|uniref:glycosyltransferase family 4 protein n=1 Tax=Rhizobium sp. BR 315 TaxID=3040014 RepID=UPI003D33A197